MEAYRIKQPLTVEQQEDLANFRNAFDISAVPGAQLRFLRDVLTGNLPTSETLSTISPAEQPPNTITMTHVLSSYFADGF